MFWIILIGIIIGLLFYKNAQVHSHFKRKGVKQGKPFYFVGDTLSIVLKQQPFSGMIQQLYDMIPNVRYSGIYQFFRPILILKDPELIKQITVKDFDHFVDHLSVIPEGYEPLWTKNLFALKGDKWREMRATLSPAFTSSKMKSMFVLISECAEQFTNYFYDQKGECIVDLRDIFTRYTNDVIATCAFGVKVDSMKEKNNEFYLMGKEATNFNTFWRNMKFFLYLTIPKIAQLFRITLFSKEVSDFFRDLVKNTVKIREENNIIRPDMINLLMEARKGKLEFEENQTTSQETGFATVEESDIGRVAKKQKSVVTDDDMTAQALIFFFAGFDSIATLMCFLGYELALNSDIQERLYAEIQDMIQENKGKITYEAVNKMQYLDMIVSETLRRWPGAAAVDRVCIDSYTISAKNPGEVDVQLDKGDVVWIPIWGIHHDPNYYPNPEKFDPERFNNENKENIKPYTFLPFGVGPRNCIGSRFALLEAKIAFVHLLNKMEICVNKKTPIPLKLQKGGFNLNAEGGFWLTLKPRA